MFKMTLPWVSALKSRIKPSWVANFALGDLPGGPSKEKQGENKGWYHNCSNDSEIRQACPSQSECSNATSCLTSRGFSSSLF